MQAIRYITLIGILLGMSTCLSGQNTKEDNSGVTRVIIEDNDTVPIIELPEISVYERKDFEYLYLKRRYRRLIHNVKRAYPYAKIAGIKLKELDDELASMKNEKKK